MTLDAKRNARKPESHHGPSNIASGNLRAQSDEQKLPEEERDYRRVVCLDAKTGRERCGTGLTTSPAPAAPSWGWPIRIGQDFGVWPLQQSRREGV